MPESDFLKWTCYLKVSQQAMGRIFKRTMGDTNKVAFCLYPINCNLQFFNVLAIPAKSRILRDETVEKYREKVRTGFTCSWNHAD